MFQMAQYEAVDEEIASHYVSFDAVQEAAGEGLGQAWTIF